MPPLTAALVVAAVSTTAFLARILTGPGAIAASLIGMAVLAGTGWAGGAALAAFFVSSSAVSRLTEGRQPGWVDAKGNRRDSWQVVANGGTAAVGGLVGFLNPGLGLWIVTGSLAAAAADTWATSLGALSREDPWHVVRVTRVPKGSSGGVSAIGTVGGLIGAVVVALAATWVSGRFPLPAPRSLLPMFDLPLPSSPLPASLSLGPIVAIGLLGMLADSLLGATVQGRFRCPTCQVASERRRHRCGTPTIGMGGWPWLDNDGVNLISTAAAGAAGAAWFLACCS
jgi:uncharacterized protein (TIGR00297 family)